MHTCWACDAKERAVEQRGAARGANDSKVHEHAQHWVVSRTE